MTWQTEAPAALAELVRLRKQIVDLLREYGRLNGTLRDFENDFLAFVLLPSYHLQQTMHLANYLEKEYERISSAIRSGEMESEEAMQEVKKILQRVDAESLQDISQKVLHIVPAKEDSETNDVILTEYEQRRLIRDFKKLVLPKVHADTSETPFDVFQSVYEAYKKKDYLMIAAFVAQYRELPPPDEEVAGFLRAAPSLEKEYRAIVEGLEKRAERLLADSGSYLEDAEQVHTQLKKQNLELRQAAVREAERVRLLRNCLEDLTGQKTARREVN